METIREQQSISQPDWVLVIDDDELYKHDDLKQLDYHLSNDRNLVYIYNPQYWFWKDFNHVCKIDEGLIKQQIKERKRRDKIFIDVLGQQIRQGEYHERIFKWDRSFHHNPMNHATISDWRNYDVYIHPFYQNKRLVYPACPRYHYGYLKKKDNIIEKFKYYSERDNGFKKDNQERILANVEVNPYILYLKGDSIVDEKTKETGHQKFNRMYPHYKVCEFNGTHPRDIQNHPYFKDNWSIKI